MAALRAVWDGMVCPDAVVVVWWWCVSGGWGGEHCPTGRLGDAQLSQTEESLRQERIFINKINLVRRGHRGGGGAT